MILKNLTKNYSTIPNELIADNEISNGAFRLYCYLASKPHTWKINNTDISKQLKIGSNNSLNKYWKELIKNGWIEKSRGQDKTGKFTGETILSLFDNHNRKKCEDGENPLSQKNHYRNNCINGKSAKHSNTNPISKTELRSKTNKEKKYIKKEFTLFNSQTSELLNNLGVDEDFAQKLIEYRKELGKPFKTTMGLNNILSEYVRIKSAMKLNAEEIFEIQAGKEWAGVKVGWIKRELEEDKKQQVIVANGSNGMDLSGFSKVGQETARNAQAAMKKIKLMQQQGGF